MTSLRRFVARDVEIGSRGVEVSGSAHACIEQDVMNRPDATANVEERVATLHVRSQLLDQTARSRERTPPLEPAQLFARILAIELGLESFTRSARHR
jgi:hypothetical protein